MLREAEVVGLTRNSEVVVWGVEQALTVSNPFGECMYQIVPLVSMGNESSAFEYTPLLAVTSFFNSSTLLAIGVSGSAEVTVSLKSKHVEMKKRW